MIRQRWLQWINRTAKDRVRLRRAMRVLDLCDHPPAEGRVIRADEFGPLNLMPRKGKRGGRSGTRSDTAKPCADAGPASACISWWTTTDPTEPKMAARASYPRAAEVPGPPLLVGEGIGPSPLR
ncbi:hypothetical protein [Amycolatopsis pigmentata]|uniref:Uncharacterized protein n=1 Tax=Amycolatopsis pigmentata TaxID=450801 RepID=A0ABW5FX29_9PSEU